MKMLNCIFLCVFILLIVLPPVLSCSFIKLKLEIKFKKYAFLVKKHLEKYYTSDTNLVAVKAKFHATVSLLQKSAVYMYVYICIWSKGQSRTVGMSQDRRARAASEVGRSVTACEDDYCSLMLNFLITCLNAGLCLQEQYPLLRS